MIKNLFTTIKDNKIMIILILILSFISYQLFIRNYKFVMPIVSVHQETYLDVWNDRALCLMEKDEAEKQLKAYNEQN